MLVEKATPEHVYSSSFRITIPRNLNLTELLHTSACTASLPPSHLIAKDNLTDRSLTLGELRTRAGRLAQGLRRALDAEDGYRHAILIPNSVDYIETFHAVLWTGGTACPINHALKPAEIAHGLCISRPDIVIVYGDTVSKVEQAIKIARDELHKNDISWERPQVITAVKSVKGYKHLPVDLMAETSLPIPHWEDTSTRLASIHLSSGTTGLPKGAQLTHYNFVANCYQLYAHDPEQFHKASRTVAYTPFVHIGMTTMPLFFGPWTGMMHHAIPSFDLETFGQLVHSNSATSFQGVPSVVLALAHTDICEKYDFSSAQVINCGGAPFKQDLMDRLLSRAPWKLIQLYGMTEAAPYVAYQRLSETFPDGVVGHLLPNIEAVLKQENSTHDAPRSGPGELWIRGPNLFQGYASNEEANRKAFPVPGWYNTGDICTITEEGLISIVGRTKELIKYKNFQVSPTELEAYLNSHPYVAEAGVAAVWEEAQLTELPTAYVILKHPFITRSQKVSVLRDIHKDIDDQVSGYKKLRGGVWEVTRIIRNPTGKILRNQLRRCRTGISSLEDADARARL
ncbi:4-coumarate-CoA ligase [Paecilomyces variotii No. 5]|uniref:4-coumarate-CoA ligase n=1 Tax=Byssochlamys spectabilis (strain No. 5 / NBRC 109023) TaxID=1356009 RepID=V5HRM1_BYSSN|nr:4-coumarate-CoA ligase [Paecilomyces variotii No. 5]